MTDAVLWDDNPSEVDLLGFDAVVAPVLAAIRAPHLDPVTIGIHGPWGGGKSTVLHLIGAAAVADSGYVVLWMDPWEFDDDLDVRGTLIAEVLGALEDCFAADASVKEKTKALLRRISWSRVGAALTKSAVTMQWDPKELIEAFTPKSKALPESMTGFRSAFADLLATLPNVERVVVLVDDLDRCLPGAVTATLEAIKLFLAVPKMVFVIAADQDMVRDAIAVSLDSAARGDRFATRYLEKIIQLPISLPRLAPHDVGESTVRRYVGEARRRRPMAVSEVTVPQHHPLGEEAEVDFGSVSFYLNGLLTEGWMFVMRLSASGKGFHRIYLNQAQQVFLDGHVRRSSTSVGCPACGSATTT